MTATLDNASGQLASGISPSSVSIPLLTGQGAFFPQPYQGTATSGGTASTLNSTGIGSKATVGQFIRNVTDGSWAFVQTVSTNSITTTALQNGSDNLWENADAWRIGEFIITLEKHDSAVPYNVTAREKALVYDRSTDTLLCSSAADRGFDGSTAQTFAGSDYVYLEVVSYTIRKLIEMCSELARLTDTNITNIASHTTRLGNLETGAATYIASTGSANAYVLTPSPVLAAYTAGNYFSFKANFTNTGAATVNVSGLGAKTIKKKDGATDLVSGDINSGQIVDIEYDGTNFQMVSPTGGTVASSNYLKTVYLGFTDGNATGASSTAINYMDTHTYTVPANDLVNGVAYEFDVGGTYTWGAGARCHSMWVWIPPTSPPTKLQTVERPAGLESGA